MAILLELPLLGASVRQDYSDDVTDAADEVSADAKKAVEAIGFNKGLGELGATMETIKDTKQAPGKIKELVENIGGGDFANVYFPN